MERPAAVPERADGRGRGAHLHPVGSELLWPGGGTGQPRCQPDPGVCQRRPCAGPAGRRACDRRRDRRCPHGLCGGAGGACELLLCGRRGAARPEPGYPGKEDRGHHRPLRQRQVHLPAAAHALLGREHRHHPLWRGGHPPGEHGHPAGTGEPCDPGDGAVQRHHREQHPHRQAGCHPRRSGSGLQKGCAGRLYPQPAQGV